MEDEDFIFPNLPHKEELESQPNQFGPIPRFKRVYEVTHDKTNGCLLCLCCTQERMGFPCPQIGCFCTEKVPNGDILDDEMIRFLSSAISVFWWINYYYYGMSMEKEHQVVKSELLKLACNDTPGVICPDLPEFCEIIWVATLANNLFCKAATEGLLNYSKDDSTVTVKNTRDRSNPNRVLSPSRAGLLQLGGLPHEDIEEDLLSNCGFLEEDFDVSTTHSRMNVSLEFNDAIGAVNNSPDKIELERILKGKLGEVTLLDRQIIKTTVGGRISMLPSKNNK